MSKPSPLSLARNLLDDADSLVRAYPKGATVIDLAGFYAEPPARVEAALALLALDGDALPFLRVEPPKDPAAVAMGRKGGARRAASMDAERRAEIARNAAETRWKMTELGKASRTAAGRAAFEAQTFRGLDERIAADLPALANEYPTGVTSLQLAERYDADPQAIYLVVKLAKRQGWCKANQGRANAGGRQTYLFTGMLKGAEPLTQRQQDVMDWLNANAQDGRVIAAMNRICNDMGLVDGTVHGHLYALEKKGRIRRLSGYDDRVNGIRVSPVYDILPVEASGFVKLVTPPQVSGRPKPQEISREEIFRRILSLSEEVRKLREMIGDANE